jgi:hypothetical protein
MKNTTARGFWGPWKEKNFIIENGERGCVVSFSAVGTGVQGPRNLAPRAETMNGVLSRDLTRAEDVQPRPGYPLDR